MNVKKAYIKLSTIIIIMVVTAVISGLTAGIIVYSSYSKSTGISYKNVEGDVALRQFLEVYSSVNEEYYEDINKNEMIEAAIKGMLDYLGDNYTTYMDINQTSMLNDALTGEYKGIGILIEDHMIKEVFSKSPAEKAGLLNGDIIIRINGIDVTDVSADEVAKRIKSSKGNMTISVSRNNEELTFELSTEKLYVPAISSKVLDDTSIGYIRIATFSSTVANQVSDALDELKDKNISSLIIDLRSNSGGFLNAAEDVSSLFLEKGKVIYSLKSKKLNDIVKDKTKAKTNYKIVVIVDENTASAAEIVASALKESYGATIVGKTSYGKGKVQQTISLIDGSMAKYTSAKWYTPNGTNIDKKGITPDVDVDLTLEKDVNGNVTKIIDSQLLKAIEVLSN
ncbi:MAG: S41 family peptidase [Bacilli bacterium]|nr:S41 family peptidase [Bacilli bacterium]